MLSTTKIQLVASACVQISRSYGKCEMIPEKRLLHAAAASQVCNVVRAFVRQCVRVSVCSCVGAFVRQCARAFMRSCVRVSVHSCVRASVH